MDFAGNLVVVGHEDEGEVDATPVEIGTFSKVVVTVYPANFGALVRPFN